MMGYFSALVLALIIFAVIVIWSLIEFTLEKRKERVL